MMKKYRPTLDCEHTASVLAELEMAPAQRARDLEREERETAVSIFYHIALPP